MDREAELQGQRELEAAMARKAELADLRAVLDTPEGVRVVRRILAATGLFRSSYTGNSDTTFWEGHRNLGLWLFAECGNAWPEAARLLLEYQKVTVSRHGPVSG